MYRAKFEYVYYEICLHVFSVHGFTVQGKRVGASERVENKEIKAETAEDIKTSRNVKLYGFFGMQSTVKTLYFVRVEFYDRGQPEENKYLYSYYPHLCYK